MVRGETVQVGIRSPRAGWGRVRHSWYIYTDNRLTLILAARAGNKLPNILMFADKQSQKLKIGQKYVILAFLPLIILF